MKRIVHATAGIAAILLIATFWSASVAAELLFDDATVALVKQYIVYGLFVLVPCLATTGLSGRALSVRGAKGLVAVKQKRMAFAAINGLVLMVPAAIFLRYKAVAGEFDGIFFLVQVIELGVGLVQLTLLGLNFRDGMRLRTMRLSVK